MRSSMGFVAGILSPKRGSFCFQVRPDGLLIDPQFFEFIWEKLRDLIDLERAGVGRRAGNRLELVAHGFEGPGGEQAVPRGIELGFSGHLADLQSRNGQDRIGRIDLVAFDGELADRPGASSR